MKLAPGQVIAIDHREALSRVLWSDSVKQSFVIISIVEKNALPRWISVSEMLDAQKSDGLILDIIDPWSWLSGIQRDSIPVTHKTRMEENWQTIKPLLMQQPEIFEAKARGTAIASMEVETGVNRVQIYRLLRRYWQRGLTQNALLPDYKTRPRFIQDVDVRRGASKRGRPPTSSHAMKVDDEAFKLMDSFISKNYARNSRLNIANAYGEFIRAHYSIKVPNQIASHNDLELKATYPSEKQFRYFIQNHPKFFDILRQRVSNRVYDANMRALLGNPGADVDGPGSRYQIDATILDVYLASRFDRTAIVGRPTLYIVIDIFSRMIVGMYLSLDPPSWVGVMDAMINVVTDKVAFCAGYGIKIDTEQWPTSGFPARLMADRGEMLGPRADALVSNFSVQIENTAAYRADWKGVVERQFRLLPAKFAPYVPGYIQSDYRARGAKDYRLDAKLTVREITEIVLLCIIEYNNNQFLKGIEASSELSESGVERIPVALWQWGIANATGQQRKFSDQLVREALLPREDATVTAFRIKFAGCFYSCSHAVERNWFAKARQKKTWKVPIGFDPRDLSTILLSDEGKVFEAALTERSRNFSGLSRAEIEQIHTAKRSHENSHKAKSLRATVNLNERINRIVAQANAEMPETSGMSKKARTGDIRINRQLEVAATRRPLRSEVEKTKAKSSAEILTFPPETRRDEAEIGIQDWLRTMNEDIVDD